MIRIIWNLLLETIQAMTGKLLFAVVSERFISRLVCRGLRKLAAYKTNFFTPEDAETIIDILKRDDLPEIK